MENYSESPQTACDAPPMPKNVPRTPPYTPVRTKRRLERSDSSASISSIQPAETTSPAKKAAKRQLTDNVRVEELVEGDAGYLTDIDVVYPDELEEKTSSAEEASSSDGEGDDSDTGISHRFQQLGCNDQEEAAFEKKRRESHLQKRTSSRLFKRSHSQSANGDSAVSDIDAMGDHDLIGSARRLRRRVRGPSGIEIYDDDMPRSSPEPGSAGLAAPFQMRGRSRASDPYESSSPAASDPDAMDTH